MGDASAHGRTRRDRMLHTPAQPRILPVPPESLPAATMDELAEHLTWLDRKRRLKLRWESFGYMSSHFLDHFFKTPEPIDLSFEGVDLVGHDGLIWLIAAAMYRQAHDLPAVIVHMPGRPAIAKAMRECGFRAAFGEVGGDFVKSWIFDDPRAEPADLPGATSLRRLQRISPTSYERHIDNVPYTLQSEIATGLRVDPTSEVGREGLRAIVTVVQELILNVFVHAGEVEHEGVGIICVKRLHPKYPVYRLCCSDVGVGLAATLNKRRGLEVSSQRAAILAALKFRGLKRRDGVLGLFQALEYVHALRGRVWIRSGSALGLLNLEKDDIGKVFLHHLHLYRSGDDQDLSWLDDLITFKEVSEAPGVHFCLDLRVPEEALVRRDE